MAKIDNCLFTKDHEWIMIDEKTATIGITDFAQNELGDIIFIEFPDVGDEFEVNDVFGAIEAVKTVADLYMPVSGKIVEITCKIEDNPCFLTALQIVENENIDYNRNNYKNSKQYECYR